MVKCLDMMGIDYAGSRDVLHVCELSALDVTDCPHPLQGFMVYESPNALSRLAIQDGALRFSFPEAHVSICFLLGRPRANQNREPRIATNRPPPMRIPKSVYQRLA